MKAKKAVKRLARVEALISNVLEQYAENQTRVRELLDSAKESVSRAKKTVNLKASKSPKKRVVSAKQPRQRRLSAAGRKALSVAAKKRWAAKRKGVQSVTQRPSVKAATA